MAVGDRFLTAAVFDDGSELSHYRSTFRSSGIVDHLKGARAQFKATVAGSSRGAPFVVGGLSLASAERLYAVLRKRRPLVAVETGVCNGFSTAVILLALAHNERGHLYSIDLPERAGQAYAADAFWEGKGGAVVPPGKEPGWAIPDELRERWSLSLGRSQELLPPLLERLRPIDFFFHDSEHSYECMELEFRLAYEALGVGGVLASDDVDWNTSFYDFAFREGRRVHELGHGVALVLKDDPTPRRRTAVGPLGRIMTTPQRRPSGE